MKQFGKWPKFILVIAGMTLAIFGFGGASAQAATLTASHDCDGDRVEIEGDGYTDCLEMGDSNWYNNIDSVCNYYDETVSVDVRQYDHDDDDDKYSKSGYMYWDNGYMYWHDDNGHNDYNHDHDDNGHDEYSLDADECITFDSADAQVSVD